MLVRTVISLRREQKRAKYADAQRRVDPCKIGRIVGNRMHCAFEHGGLSTVWSFGGVRSGGNRRIPWWFVLGDWHSQR